MRKYTEQQIATIVRMIINDKYDSAAKIKMAFNLNRKVQSINFQKLTDAELEIKTTEYAQLFCNNLNMITDNTITNKLSRQFKQEIYNPGIELATYKDYLEGLAKDIVSDLIVFIHNVNKKKYDAAKRKWNSR